MAREYTSQPPGIKSWGDKCEEENQQGHTLAGTGNQGAVEVPAAQHLKVAIGTRVECLFKSVDDPDGTWFGGVVTSRREDGLWHVEFDDGDDGDFGDDDPDLRHESTGPWGTWLDTYLPDLLLSAYRAARRAPTQLDLRFFKMLQYPEDFSNSAEFQARNFCDVVNLCDNDSDTVSTADTPAKLRQPLSNSVTPAKRRKA